MEQYTVYTAALLTGFKSSLAASFWIQARQLADREGLVCWLIEGINNLNSQKVTAGKKFLPWGHSWIQQFAPGLPVKLIM